MKLEMGRGGVIFKRLGSRYRIGDRLQGFNDGLGRFCLYRSVVQPVLITKVPWFPGDNYNGFIIGFESDVCSGWDEADLFKDSDYEFPVEQSGRPLEFGDEVEFMAGPRYNESQMSVIADVPGTWVRGMFESAGRHGVCRVIHPKWDSASDSRELVVCSIPIERIRRRK